MGPGSTLRKVLTGCFFVECNSFAQGRTTRADFEATGLLFGDDITPQTIGQQGEYTAAAKVLKDNGFEILPTIYAWTTPRPAVDDSFIDEIEAVMRDVARRHSHEIAGVYLQLHGAALAVSDDDPESRLLASLRKVLPAVPIVASFDHHAYVTPAMLRHLSGLTAYRTSPHVDLERTGAAAARLLVATINGDCVPCIASARVPMLAPADLLDSAAPGFGGLMRILDDLEARPGVLSVSAFPMTPWLDVASAGWRAVAVTNNDPELAAALCTEVAARMWELRTVVVGGERVKPLDSITNGQGSPHLRVVADAGDATNGGSAGDSTVMLRAALDAPDIAVWIPIVDETLLDAMFIVGPGGEAEFVVGGGEADTYNATVSVCGVVSYLAANAVCSFTHPMMAGVKADLGRFGVLSVGNSKLFVHERAVSVIDASVFEVPGWDPTTADVLVVKSQVTFKSGFDGLSDDLVVVDTPGPTSLRLESLPYRRRPKPLFPFESPEDDVCQIEFATTEAAR